MAMRRYTAILQGRFNLAVSFHAPWLITSVPMDGCGAGGGNKLLQAGISRAFHK